jgi:Tfp pilus assembly protein PilP
MLSTLRLPSLTVALALVAASPNVTYAQSTPSPASKAESTAGAKAAAPVQTPQAAPAPVPTADGAGGPQLEPQGYTYDPAGRRDPFVSLLRRGADPQNPTSGSRPAGLAGLETNEITLKGTVASQGTFVGILQGSDNKTYIVKSGDKLLDGKIRTISQDSMVITQQVNDPLSLEKEREVRKMLRQTTDEAK